MTEEKKIKPMWSAIHHDRQKNLMFVWYTDGTRTAVKTKHRFFTPMRGEYGSSVSGMKDIYGRDMYEVICDSRTEMDYKNQNAGRHNHLSECDIDFRTRWLQRAYQDLDDIRFSVKDVNICYIDIEVATRGKFPSADKALYPINCVTIYFSKYDKYYTYGLNQPLKEETVRELAEYNCEYINCPTERDLLHDLFVKISENEADILTGWNSDFFDIPYIVKRAETMEVPLRLLSRLPDQYKTAYISKQDNSLVIAGTEVVDFLKLYRKFNFSERDNYKLDTIGAVEVGERKAPLPNGYLTYLTDWDKFILYNFQDVRLMTKIEQKCRMFDATFTACSEARVPFSAIFESKKMLVGFILNFLHKKHLVMPPLKENTREWFPGAYVYATPGYYLHLVSYDYRSMYPSIMMGANISPETKVVYPIDEVIPEEVLKTLVRSPWNANGQRQVFYRKDISGIVPQVVKTLFDGRTDLKKMMKKVRKEGNLDLADFYDMKQKTYKLLGNSLYGLLGNPYFQLYDIDNSASVTAFGKALITTTVDRLCNYIDNEMKDDIRFEMLFGYKAPIDPQLTGSYESDEGVLTYRRVSHGDTDSFFVKYSDIYKPYMEMIDKKLEVVVFKGNELIERSMFDYVTEEGKAKKAFNSACVKYCPSWSDPETDNTKKKKIFAEGILMDKGYRVIYNRFCLTDFCRMMDAGIMEEKLAEFMSDYANQWNYYENTLFLKREKCIHQTIVTAKKKYICRIESNEDEKYLDKETLTPKAKFGITGLEIVRSSTTPFSRDHIMTLLDKMFKNMDKGEIRKEYLKIKEEFFQKIDRKEYYDISIPSGVKSDPPKYSDWITWSDTERSKVDWRLRAGSVWNHLIETDEVLKEGTLEPIFEASKVKFIKVCENKYGLNSIAYVGDKCPDRLLEIFTPDWNEQWIKTFSQTMDRLFEAVGWGKGLENDERDTMVDLF